MGWVLGRAEACAPHPFAGWQAPPGRRALWVRLRSVGKPERYTQCSLLGGVILKLTPEKICSLECFKDKDKFFDNYQSVCNSNLSSIDIPLELGEYQIKYAPVGNYPEKPQVIICGKTTSGRTHDTFIRRIQEGSTLHEACFSSIYSNMRDNLYIYLSKIRLFDYLAMINPYWQVSDFRSRWNAMFGDLNSSLSSGVQLTQAFNCAILNKDSHMRSSEPKKKAFQKINSSIGCLFKQFYISEELRLIIFLDTPCDRRRFHQSDFFRPSQNNIPVISITHPSRQNSYIYKNLENWEEIRNDTVRKNAKKLFENAKNTIESLMKVEHCV